MRDVEMRNTIEMLFGAGLSDGGVIEWVKAGSSPADGGFDTYYDPATILKEGDIAKMWHLHNFKTSQTVEGKAYLSLKNLVEYDCKDPRRRTLYFSWKALAMGAGETVCRRDEPTGWMRVAPGSMGAVLRALACSTKTNLDPKLNRSLPPSA
jgi:hypothetical protein